jgi:Zc3h12a-like Ribonuclease NYN domain/S1 RNA binding domain
VKKKHHLVVDGSNIATEGRQLPSLAQLEEALEAFLGEHKFERVTVVVDATFGHRINTKERRWYEEAVAANRIITPPAGAIGRGDAFVLSIASRADATVFSNDSFQEFHGQYTWLFDEGRLIGGKPIPGVGWVFVLRSPVRGVASRRSTQRATRAAKTTEKSAPKKSAPKRSAPKTPVASAEPVQKSTQKSAQKTTQARSKPARESRKRGSRPAPEPVNDPLAFLAFVSHHPVGSEVVGTVDRFSSHGAYVAVGAAQCYIPLRLMADPPPKSAKELLSVGDTRSFVVESFDSPRRSIDLAIPGLGTSTASGLEPGQSPPAEEAPSMAAPRKTAAKKKSTAKRAPAKKKATARKSTARKTTTKRAPAKKKAAKKKAPARKKTAAKKTTARKKSTAKRSPAKRKAPAKKKTATRKKSTTRRAPAKKR